MDLEVERLDGKRKRVGTSENGRGTGEEGDGGECGKIYNIGKCSKENYCAA